MEYEKFREVYKKLHGFHYMILDKEIQTEEGTVYGGHLATKDFKKQIIFRTTSSELPDMFREIKPSVKNFTVSGDRVLCASNLDTLTGYGLKTKFMLGSLGNMREKCFFNLLMMLTNEDVYIEIDESVVSLESISFSKTTTSVTVTFIDKEGFFKTKKLMWFTDIPHLEEFNILSKKSLEDTIKEYLEGGEVQEEKCEMFGVPMYRYKISEENLNCNPLNQNTLQHFSNKQMLLTTLAEQDMWNSYVEGLECALKVMKVMLQIEPDESYGYSRSSGVKGKNIKFLTGRKSYNTKYYGEIMFGKFPMLKEYVNGEKSRVEFEKELRAYLGEELIGLYGEFALEGMVDAYMCLDKGNFLKMKEVVNKYRQRAKKESLALNIYNYFWRTLYVDYTYLLRENLALFRDGMDNQLQGGAYDLDVIISY